MKEHKLYLEGSVVRDVGRNDVDVLETHDGLVEVGRPGRVPGNRYHGSVWSSRL